MEDHSHPVNFTGRSKNTRAESGSVPSEWRWQIRNAIDSAGKDVAAALLQAAALSPNSPLQLAALCLFCDGDTFLNDYAPYLDIQENNGRFYISKQHFHAIHDAVIQGASRRELKKMRDKYSTTEKRTYSDGRIKIERRITAPANGKKRVAKSYTFRIYRDGRSYTFPVGADKAQGLKKARQIHSLVKAGKPIEDVLREFHPKSPLLKSLPSAPIVSDTAEPAPPHKTSNKPSLQKVATVGEVIQCFRNHAQELDIKKTTAGGYACQLRKILTLGVPALSGSSKGAHHKLLISPISLLDDEAVRRFKQAMFDKANDEKARVKARTNINSALRQAKSMFTDRAMDLYKRNGLNVPRPDDFQAEKSMKGPKNRYRLPNMEMIEKLFAEIPELKASNSHHYIARLLGLYAGLRPNEIRWLRKDQVRFNGYWYIAIEVTEHFSPKHYHVRDIPIPENLAKHLLAISEDNDSDFIIGGNQNYRSDKLFREINTHLRNNFFVGIQKPSHELRKLYGSVLAKHHDRDTAQEWLGHEDPKTTVDSYVDKRTPMKLVEIWQTNAKRLFGGPAFAEKV